MGSNLDIPGDVYVQRTGNSRSQKKICEWAEARGGKPAKVKGTEGLLRIDFGEPEETLEPISWEEFFEKFDESDVKFLYDPDPNSRFNKFVRD
jgi:hypothetical protein